MATLTVRDLPDDVRDKLRIRAAENGRSMEAEVRSLLAASVGESRPALDRAAWEARVREMQAAFAPYRNSQSSVVDELIAERREEARREDAEVPLVYDGQDSATSSRKSQAEKLAEARAILRRHVPADRSLVDEFLAERRSLWGEE